MKASLGIIRVALFLVVSACIASVADHSTAAASDASAHAGVAAKQRLDHSGRKRIGKASFYADRFAGRKMADGRRMNPHGDNAASRTLPLGTKAKVTDLETGRSAVVNIEDRGPYVKGRVVDLSPATARQIGIDKEKGVAPVEVAPIAVPQADGSIRPGAAAVEARAERGGTAGAARTAPP